MTTILASDPSERPTLHEIVVHPFLSEGTFPPYIPYSANDGIPNFHRISRASSEINYREVKRRALLDEDQISSIALPKSVSSSSSSSSGMRNVASTIAQQEKEFQKAVQPGSPIAALLNSARQPLVMSTNAGGAVRESPLMRKLQAARPASSPLGPGRTAARRGLHGIQEEETAQQLRERAGQKEVESMKTRIVVQMVEKEESDEEPARHPVAAMKAVDNRENRPPLVKPLVKRSTVERISRPVKTGPPMPTLVPAPVAISSSEMQGQQLRSRLTGFEAAEHVLSLAFDAKDKGRLFRDPREDPRLPLYEEKVFICSWVDYCIKYGMGYALTDGSVGVHFNDSSTLILSADKQ